MTDPSSEPTVAELLDQLRLLSQRVEQLEALVARQTFEPEVPEDVVLAVSAAVAAFLGHRAKIKQVHYRTGAAYAQQGRAVVQGRHNLYGSR